MAATGLPVDAMAQLVADTPPTLFLNVNVFDGKLLTLRKGMSVLVRGGRITTVKHGPLAAPAGATVIDGAGGPSCRV